MHKHIFAAIVALDESKTLHVVEEFHGAVGAFAGRFALRCAWSRITVVAAESTAAFARCTVETATLGTVIARGRRGHSHRLAIDDDVRCRYLATTFDQRELEGLSFGKSG